MGVSIIGCGDYETLAKHRAGANNCPLDSAEFQRRFPAGLAALLQAHDPVHRTADMAACKLRVVGAGNDTLVPPVCNARFLERLRAAGNTTVEEVIVPDLPHMLAPPMIVHAAEWFKLHTAA